MKLILTALFLLAAILPARAENSTAEVMVVARGFVALQKTSNYDCLYRRLNDPEAISTCKIPGGSPEELGAVFFLGKFGGAGWIDENCRPKVHGYRCAYRSSVVDFIPQTTWQTPFWGDRP